MRADAEALYNANHRGLFRYFCRAVGHVETARDLTQDVFVRVSRSVIPAAPEAALAAGCSRSPGTWLWITTAAGSGGRTPSR